ncbi:MAG: hypothetical protein K9M57_07580 [Phycisphaerae bacterium]|nr:hypothetical protein [Phycisphaerae bacterium]
MNETTKGGAFARGGCGCLIGFCVLGLLVALIGGNFHIDIGGALMLFVIGGVIGLIVLAIYNKGKNDSQNDDYHNQDEPKT